MSFLQSITPINLQEEKAKFFADQTYNPQFRYAKEIDQENLVQYGKPKEEYVALATSILNKTFSEYSEDAIEQSEGKKLTQQDVEDTILTFLKMHHMEDRFSLVWSASFLSRTSISTDTIKLRLPADFRQESLLGMLYHEIGTHALRRINYEQQPWYKKKNKYGFSEYLFTEEGLAALHGLLPHTIKYAYKQARLYLGVSFAQNGSFVETWDQLHPYVRDFNKRWALVSRLKRGISDTSQNGGYTKDLVYFEGVVETWRWLRDHNWDCTPLYYGKIAATDVERAREFSPDFTPFLPYFYSKNMTLYANSLRDIGLANSLDK